MDSASYWDHARSPFGEVTVVVDETGCLTELRLDGTRPCGQQSRNPCASIVEQLEEYFHGNLKRFELGVNPSGTAFQHRVWQALQKISYGEVSSYGELARRIGQPGASRAVGQANGANPIPIIIPCHRVVSSNGSLGGYSGGLSIKAQLLALEGIRLAA